MAKSIFDYLRSRPYYDMAWDRYAVKKVALEWAIDSREDIVQALSPDTINQVLALLMGGE